ncbi:hypothetical protein VNO78_35904 [Psophocarpus tetragonolobus]|uniref:Uncharacterized protein n=1 Tax=Psophocarpus tetragonolobus TaxID=3891 RepID=A0AAN9NLJ2_PSOTE
MTTVVSLVAGLYFKTLSTLCMLINFMAASNQPILSPLQYASCMVPKAFHTWAQFRHNSGDADALGLHSYLTCEPQAGMSIYAPQFGKSKMVLCLKGSNAQLIQSKQEEQNRESLRQRHTWHG